MGSEAQREMTLAEWVDRLPEIHGARKELSALIAAAERADAAEARVRELEAEVSKWMQDHHSECAKVQELEEALAFYADRKTYTYDNELDEIRVFVDGGNRARTALGKESRT